MIFFVKFYFVAPIHFINFLQWIPDKILKQSTRKFMSYQNNLLKKISFEYKLYDWFILPLLVSHDQCSRSVVAVVAAHK